MRVALLLVALATGLAWRPTAVWASHIRAGEITAKGDTTVGALPGSRRVFFKMVLYTDIIGIPPNLVVTQPSVTIFFGDGTATCTPVPRSTPAPLPIPGNNDTALNIYYFEHTYPSVGTFTVRFTGENRNQGVVNMDNSLNQSFYIATTVVLGPTLNGNRSPVLRAPAIDKAGVGQVFLHNPAAFDADGDSLTFELQPSQKVDLLADDILGPPCPGETGTNTPLPVVVPGFRYPNDPSIGPNPLQVAYTGVPPGRVNDAAIFVQDRNTGQITWNAPGRAGIYNVAMIIREYRRAASGGASLIGSVIRDMQIVVVASNNLRPTITIPEDICVIAGEVVTGTVTAVDGVSPTSTPQTPVALFAYSGIIPPATFQQTTAGPPQAQGTFRWQTQCNDVARLPYLVVFKAQDTPTPITPSNQPLIDEKTWRITVVGPPPQNLRAVPEAITGLNRVTLNWNPYICANATRIHIYRKEGTGPDPGPCVTGIPASSGYVRIATVPATATSYIDNNPSTGGANQGFERGKTYCYRIYAEFPGPAFGASIASAEACATFGGRSAQLTNVDVETTSTTTGRVFVRWTQPRPVVGLTFDGTPSYVLTRGEGLAPTTFVPVRTITTLTDTTLVDTNLNTQDRQYTYKLEFVRTLATGPPVVETSPTASSVRITTVPTNLGTTMTVSWTYNVPWDNATRPVTIFRRGNAPGSAFVQVGTAPTTATGGSYVDRDPTLVKGETYCYYVQTNGLYPGIRYLDQLLNKSQEQCAALIPPPCTPVLTLAPTDCEELANQPEFPKPGDTYTNRLSWTLSNLPTGCDATIASYRLYYRPALTGPFALLATTTQPSYVHSGLEFSGGCYAVQAVAASGAVSDTSNVACQDNCLFFRLPNIFTPNGDAQNDVFRPKNSSPVRRIHFQAFNRWGVKVFENTTTSADRILINWNGVGATGESSSANAGKPVGGIYYYLAEVEFADFANTKRTYKGWVEIIR
jgi:hypothetical protein